MPTGREELAHALLLHVAAGTFEVQDVVPALRALAGEAGGSVPTRLALLQFLRAEPLEGLGPVVEALLRHRVRDAETAHTRLVYFSQRRSAKRVRRRRSAPGRSWPRRPRSS